MMGRVLLNLVSIPVGILSASLLSKAITSAVNTIPSQVAQYGFLLVSIMILTQIVTASLSIFHDLNLKKQVNSCKRDLYQVFLSNSLSALYAENSGDAKEKLSDDFNTVINKYANVYPGIVCGIITVASYFIYLASKDLLISIILLIISLLQILPPFIVEKQIEKNYDDTREIEAELTDYTIAAHHGFTTIKLFGLKKWYLDGLEQIHKRYSKIGTVGIMAGTTEGVLNDLVSNILKYGTYAIMGMFVLYGRSSLDSALQAIAISIPLYQAVNGIFSVIPKLGEIKVANRRLEEWIENRQGSVSVPENSEITLQNLEVCYDGKALYSDVSLSFPTEGLCLIKGRNGSGKTTLFQILTGILQPSSGIAKVGGVWPISFAQSVFPDSVFYLQQEDTMFTFSPYELFNMNNRCDEYCAVEAAKEFGMTDEQIYQTKISNLSGGERKKIYLAYAIAVDPPILMLDEPTNAIDEKGRMVLKDYLAKRKRLTLLITHDSCFDDIPHSQIIVNEGQVYEEC